MKNQLLSKIFRTFGHWLLVLVWLLVIGSWLFSPLPVFAGELSNQFTIELWVKPVSSVASKALVVKNNEIRLVTNASSQPLCQIYSSGTWQTAATSSTALSLNTWSHVACTYDKTTLKVFLNGVLVGSQALSVALDDSATNFRAGSDEGGTYGDFNGWVDDIQFYNYARTQKQIVEDMNAGHPAVGSPVGSSLAWYKFDEGFGTTVNNSGNAGPSINGTFGSGSSAPSWSNEGKFGKALSFDGSDDYVTTNSTTFTDFTWIIWFKTNSTNNSRYLGGRTSNIFIRKGVNCATNKLNLGVQAGSWDEFCSNSTFNANQWYQIAYSFNSSSSIQKLYINGKLDNSDSVNITNLQSTGNLAIGTTPWALGVDSFNGLIDEVKIYNYALSEDEIKAEYNRGAAMVLGSLSDTSGLTGGSIASNSASAEYCVPGDTSPCAPPVGRWDFEERQGNNVYDSSGNGNTGTWSGSGPTRFVSGKIGKAGQFNGTDDYVNIGTGIGLDPSTSLWTVSVWIKTTDSNGIILCKSGSTACTGSPDHYSLIITNGNAQFNFSSGDAEVKPTSTTLINDNKWHYILGIRSGVRTGEIYVDGKLENTHTPSGSSTGINAGNNFILGQYNSSNFYSGNVDHIRIYNYARTPAQITWDYNRGKPVAHYKLDECSGTTIRSTNDPYNPSLNATLTIGASGSQTSAGTCASGNSTHAWYNGSSGKFNASLNFDGTDDYAASDNIALIASASQTYSNLSWGAWVKAASNQTDKTIIHKSGEFRLYTDSNGYPTCQVGDTGNTAVYSSALPNNTWSHLICAYDGSNIRLYINGKLAASNSRTGTITSSSSTNINIAQRSDSSQRYAGQVDEVKIWNYGLTSTLVKNEYDQSAAIRFGPEEGSP